MEISTNEMLNILNDNNYAIGSINFPGSRVYKLNGGFYWEGDLEAPIVLDSKTANELWDILPKMGSFTDAYDAYLNGKRIRLNGVIYQIDNDPIIKTIMENKDLNVWEILN